MKRFSTLMTALAVFLTTHVHAQYVNNFDDYNSLTSNCWSFTNVLYTTVSGEVINGTGSIYSNPPTSSVQTRNVGTPFLDVTGGSISISYWYKTTGNVNGQTVRTIQAGLEDKNGVFTPLNTLTIDNKSGNTTIAQQYTGTFNNITPGVYRLVLKLGGDTGGGTIRLIVDDLYASSSPHYGNGTCNTAPVALPDTYDLILPNTFSDNVITNLVNGSDYDLNAGESITAAIVQQPDPLQGTVVLQPDGSFTFTPASTFTGGIITFTYRLTDNGFTPATSNTATVTLNYPVGALIPMPVKLMNFAGSAANNHAQLRWSVADNETGDHFELLRSADGRHFTGAGVIFINNKVGAQSYTFGDPKELDAVTYYQLKIVNKDGSITYSNVIILKNATDKAGTGITILQNPVGSTLTFTYSTSAATQGQLTIYNTLGAKVYSSRLSSQKGTNSVSLSLDSHMATGTYILEVVNGSERAVARMIKK